MRILIVDDDRAALAALTGMLHDEHELVACDSGAAALDRIAERRFDLLITDLSMPPPDGFALIEHASTLAPVLPVIVLTGLDTARAALRALELGAGDFLVKPCGADAVRAAVGRLAPRGDAADDGEFGLFGRSAAMALVRRMIPLVASSREAVLVTGETGTGKELLARAVHDHGPRRARPFVAHNMAATPAELAESLFFGHVRGSFSGATGDREGLFERAEGGTLFLDEVDSFPLGLQAKLLRALEGGVIQRVGSGAERPVDVRVVAASSTDLGTRVARGEFRADLYYRLRQIEILLTPLRERLEDLPGLAQHFLREAAAEGAKPAHLTPAALQALMAHDWPGNCRELRAALRSAGLLAAGEPIQPGHLPGAIARRAAAATGGAGTLAAVEREHIHRVVERAGGNHSLAARILGIDRGTLARKLREMSARPRGE